MVSAPAVDAVTRGDQIRRSGIARWIRRLAIPIIAGWIALIALLSVTVPQLEAVGQMQSVSMSPKDAPSVIAMQRVGKVFAEFDSDNSAMIVLEGEQPLGEDAHRFYDGMIDKLEADTEHVQHIQDFWGDPLTRVGAQSSDGKAAYVQVYLAGNMGEDLANESVIAVQKLVAALTPPPGVKVFVTGGSALQADQQDAGDRSVRIIEIVTIGVIVMMLLFFYRSIVTVLIVLSMVVLGLSATRGMVAFLGYHHLIGLSTFATQLLVTLAIAATTDYAIFLIGRYQEARALGEDRESRVLHHVPRHRSCGAGLGTDDRRRDLLPFVHSTALLSDAGHPAGSRHGHRGVRRADVGPRADHGRQPLRTDPGTQAGHAHPRLAADGRRRGSMAGPFPARDDGAFAGRSPGVAGIPAQLQRSQLPPTRSAGERGIRGGGATFPRRPDESRNAACRN